MTRSPGRVEYTNDLYLPGMLYAKPLLSTSTTPASSSWTRARPNGCRESRAVATAKDAPDNVNGLIIPDQPVFADDKVRYKGEIVALVAAETEEIAQEAVELIEIEYEPLPAVFDPREALEQSCPLHPRARPRQVVQGKPGDAARPRDLLFVHGDIDKGFRRFRPHRRTHFWHLGQRCAPLEPHACIAKPEGTDRITIIGNTQMPFWHQPAIAKALRLPLNRVRMITAPIGGAFGQKNNITIEPNLAILAMKAGRPVKWALTTHEDFCYTSTKIPVYHTYKMGLKSDGTLIALDRKHIANTGAYASTTMITMGKCTYIGAGPYLVPHQRGETWVVYYEQVPECGLQGLRHVATHLCHRADDGHHRRKAAYGSSRVSPEEPHEGRRSGRHRPGYARGWNRGLPEEGGRDERLGDHAGRLAPAARRWLTAGAGGVERRNAAESLQDHSRPGALHGL